MTTVRDVFGYIDSFAPFGAAEKWDNVGLLLGDENAAVTGIVAALDLTADILNEAAGLGANLVVTHHPVIFDPLKRLESSSVVYKAARLGVHVISAHTSLDVAPEGVNQALAETLELRDPAPLCEDGLGRIGLLPYAMTARQLAGYVKERLGCKGLRFYEGPGQISCVALCGGAGGSLLEEACHQGAQALITADVKHSVFLEAKNRNMTVIDGGHFATENVIIPRLANRLCHRFPQLPVTVASANMEVTEWL